MADINVDPQTLVWGAGVVGGAASRCERAPTRPAGVDAGRGSPTIVDAARVGLGQWERAWSQAHTDLDTLSDALSTAASVWMQREEDLVAALNDLIAASGVGRG